MPRRLLPPPERRRRADVVVAVGLGRGRRWRGPCSGRRPRTTARSRRLPRQPCPAPPEAAAVRRASPRRGGRRAPRRPVPVVAGPVVVTGDGDAVDGPRRADRRGPVELHARHPAVHRRRRLPGPRRRPRAGALPQRHVVQRADLAAPGHRHPRPPAQPRRPPGHPPARRRVAGHRDGPDLPRGVPVGSRAHRRVRRRAHAPAGRPTAPSGLRVDGLRRDLRPGRRAAALPGRGRPTG